jgi:hypothetical protein
LNAQQSRFISVRRMAFLYFSDSNYSFYSLFFDLRLGAQDHNGRVHMIRAILFALCFIELNVDIDEWGCHYFARAFPKILVSTLFFYSATQA